MCVSTYEFVHLHVPLKFEAITCNMVIDIHDAIDVVLTMVLM